MSPQIAAINRRKCSYWAKSCRSASLYLLLLVLLPWGQPQAQPFLYQNERLTPTPVEQALVTDLNSAYYAAFNLPREENWVLKKVDDGTLNNGCWLDQNTFYPLQSREMFAGTEMQCIQVGKSTRIFWPSRWVNFCNQIKVDYGRCVIAHFNPG